jgi:hypothetical protein
MSFQHLRVCPPFALAIPCCIVLRSCKLHPHEKTDVSAGPDSDHEDLTVSSLNTISTESSTGISEYKDHLRRPMSESEQLVLGEKLGNRVGITNPEFCKMLAAAFREQQLQDIQEFGMGVLDFDA